MLLIGFLEVFSSANCQCQWFGGGHKDLSPDDQDICINNCRKKGTRKWFGLILQ